MHRSLRQIAKPSNHQKKSWRRSGNKMNSGIGARRSREKSRPAKRYAQKKKKRPKRPTVAQSNCSLQFMAHLLLPYLPDSTTLATNPRAARPAAALRWCLRQRVAAVTASQTSSDAQGSKWRRGVGRRRRAARRAQLAASRAASNKQRKRQVPS